MRTKQWIYVLFFASGASSLMYQVVWLRILSRTTGITIHATATVIAAFMAGLALGSYFIGRMIDKRNDELRVYGILEFLIGGVALLIPTLFSRSVPIYSAVYAAGGENVPVTALVMGAVSFVTLLIPTALMGGTLPVLTSYLVKRQSLLGKHLGLLYGINTLGAVYGVVLSGFFLIGLFGETATIGVAVLINFVIGAGAYIIFRSDSAAAPERPIAEEASNRHPISPYSSGTRRVILVAFCISGFTALAYEVIWTRQLILFLLNSVYAFSAMLAVFLTGVALGSVAVNNRADRLQFPLLAFGILELAVACCSVINLHLFSPMDTYLVADRVNGWIGPIVATILLVFPITFGFGMIFPIAARCYAKSVEEVGSFTGRFYAVNTVGCIAGALLAGFYLVPSLGSSKTVMLLGAANAGVGLILILLEMPHPSKMKYGVSLGTVFVILLGFTVAGGDPFLGTIRNRIFGFHKALALEFPKKDIKPDIFLNEEGLAGTVTAFGIGPVKQLFVNGVGMTVLCTDTKLMAHLPVMLASTPREMLVICFGMGTTVKSASIYPDLNITAVELVSECFRTFGFYHPGAEGILKRPQIRLVANDGRNHLLLSKKRYDVITVDPPPPLWSAGTVNLYTEEFFRLCKSRLNPDGAMCLWLCQDERSVPAPVIRTFAAVFPHCTVWSGITAEGCYLLGKLKPMPADELQQRIKKAFQNPKMIADLKEYDDICATPEKLASLLRMTEANVEVVKNNREIPLITDDYPVTEFFLWR